MAQDHFETNRNYWNHLADIHFDSEFYDNATFLAGRSPLNDIERSILGDDLSGQRALHLQCHFGQDTIGLARMGAQATGVDLSDTAVEKARLLAEKTGASADFVRCNVLEIDEHLEGQYDLIFSSYGTIGWLPKIDRWGQLIAQFLKPGGRFVFAEFHPVVWTFDDAFTYLQYPYFNRETIVEEVTGSYGRPDDTKTHTCVSWNHPLSEVLTALLDAGLILKQFKEYDYSPYDCFQKTVKVEKGYQIQGMEGTLPLVYALEAIKPA